MGKYRKTIVAVIGVLVVALGTHYGADEWFKDIVLALTALGVYQVPNRGNLNS